MIKAILAFAVGVLPAAPAFAGNAPAPYLKLVLPSPPPVVNGGH
jgi:hypothetical protein